MERNSQTQTAQCSAIARSGERCRRRVEAGDLFCSAHDPHRAEERSRNASIAAKSKPLSESAEIRKELRRLMKQVEDGKVDRQKASTIAYIASVILGSLRTDAKLRELEEIEGRLRELEQTAQGIRR